MVKWLVTGGGTFVKVSQNFRNLSYLGRYSDIRPQDALQGGQMERGGGDDNFGVGTEGTGLVKDLGHLAHASHSAVALPVASDQCLRDLLAGHGL